MKGIAHFSVGVAAASLFPAAVEAGAAGNPWYFLLGGAFGLLPDTLDFKFARYFVRPDVTVMPDPNAPDPGMIADAVAASINRAAGGGKAVLLKLHTIPLGAERRRRCTVRFDPANCRVVVSMGPIVDTGGTVIEKDSTSRRSASAALSVPIKLDYQATTVIDAFDGPEFRMEPAEDGSVIPRFIPWHRKWSHSLVLAAGIALCAGLLWNPLAGAVIALAYAGHILVDQLGYMGSNLFYPFSKRRMEGLKRLHSGAAIPNFWAVWLSCLTIFWNLYRALPSSDNPFRLLTLIFYGVALPATGITLYRRFVGRTLYSGQ